MQRLEVSGAVRPIYGSLGVKRLSYNLFSEIHTFWKDCFPLSIGIFASILLPNTTERWVKWGIPHDADEMCALTA